MKEFIILAAGKSYSNSRDLYDSRGYYLNIYQNAELNKQVCHQQLICCHSWPEETLINTVFFFVILQFSSESKHVFTVLGGFRKLHRSWQRKEMQYGHISCL